MPLEANFFLSSDPRIIFDLRQITLEEKRVYLVLKRINLRRIALEEGNWLELLCPGIIR